MRVTPAVGCTSHAQHVTPARRPLSLLWGQGVPGAGIERPSACGLPAAVGCRALPLSRCPRGELIDDGPRFLGNPAEVPVEPVITLHAMSFCILHVKRPDGPSPERMPLLDTVLRHCARVFPDAFLDEHPPDLAT